MENSKLLIYMYYIYKYTLNCAICIHSLSPMSNRPEISPVHGGHCLLCETLYGKVFLKLLEICFTMIKLCMHEDHKMTRRLTNMGEEGLE